MSVQCESGKDVINVNAKGRARVLSGFSSANEEVAAEYGGCKV